MTYSEVLWANFESGTWIMYDSKLSRESVDPDASMERNTWMNQNKATTAQLVWTIDIDHVKSKMEGIPDDQKPLMLLNLNGVTSTNANSSTQKINDFLKVVSELPTERLSRAKADEQALVSIRSLSSYQAPVDFQDYQGFAVS